VGGVGRVGSFWAVGLDGIGAVAEAVIAFAALAAARLATVAMSRVRWVGTRRRVFTLTGLATVAESVVAFRTSLATALTGVGWASRCTRIVRVVRFARDGPTTVGRITDSGSSRAIRFASGRTVGV